VTRDAVIVLLRERIRSFAASQYGRDLGDDLAQDVFVVLQERYSHLESLDDLVPLAMKIARFKLAGLRRKSFRRGEPSQISVEDLPLADSSPDAETIANRREMAERLSASLLQMEGRCREIFRMKLEGLSFPEIQNRLGVKSINTVYTWEARCRKRLLELMGGHWERKA
jgi:RNA polymerase sigma-70 factor (ECF subfamily)